MPEVSWAAETAENKAGAGIGIAIGDNSKTDKFAKNQIAIGVGAKDVSDGSAPNDAAIAIGAGAHTYNELGRRVATISFGKAQKDYTGGIAIGTKTYAITGGTSIGQRDYTGKMGDVTVSDENRDNLQYAPGATSLGSNAYAGGTLATVIGAYNISSSGYNGKGGLNSAYYVAQNLGSTILGTLNTNESAQAKDTDLDYNFFTGKATIKSSSSGIANSIVGVANEVKNSNGSIVLGAGNTVSNSSTKIVDDITGSLSELMNWQPKSYQSVNDMAQDLRDRVKSSKSGGSTLVIGGGNTADYTQRTQIIGVNNTVTGTEEKPSDYNMVNAFGTDVTNSSHFYTIGDNNHITDTNRTIVFGDNRYVSTTNDSIIIGSSDKSDKPQYTTATDATIIGHNANAWGNRGMALGKDVYTTGDDSVAIGSGVAAYSKNSIAIGSSDGFYKTAVTDYSKDKPTEGGIAIGMGTLTNASHGTAIGYHAMVTNVDGYALGSQASVSADKGVAIGYKATATVGDNALALGTSATSSGRDNIAIGTQAIATSNGATEERTGERMALGAHSNVSGYASTAIGSYVNVNGDYSVGIGSHDAKGYASTNVSGARAVGIGVQANVAGESAVGIGDTAIANGKKAVAIGKNANASNEDAFAFGTLANSSSKRALALGASANANHEDSVALGTSALAAGNNALALGTNANVSGDNGIAIGASVTEQDENKHVKSSMAVAKNSTAIGTAASATGVNSIVIGSYEMNQDGTVKNAQAVARDSMAFGTAANAWGQEGIAFGKDTGAGQNAIALGSNANAWKNHSTAIGNSAVGGAEYGVAIGEGAIVTNRYKDNGKGEYVEDTEHPATDAVAIGHNAQTNVKGGVALGAGSVASREAGVAGYDPATKTDSTDSSATWKATDAAVSVGKADGTMTRQITGVAAGSAATDAVNVAQLKQVSDVINNNINANKVHYYSVKSKYQDDKSNYNNNGANGQESIVLGIASSSDAGYSTVIGMGSSAKKRGTSQASGMYDTVVGQYLDTTGSYNSVFGTFYQNGSIQQLTKVYGDRNTVLGAGNIVGIGKNNTKVKSDENVVIGLNNSVEGSGSIIVGNATTVNGPATMNATSLGHVNHIYDQLDGGGQWGVALGNNLTVKGEYALAVGNNSTAQGDETVAVGYNANASVAGGAAIGSGSVASVDKGVEGYKPNSSVDTSADPAGTWKSTDAAVSVGKADGSMTRQITGVAAGTNATDAVNVAQLRQAVAGAKDGNDTLKSDTNALKLDGHTLSMSVKDTANHEVSGSVDLSELARAVDTNTTYTLTGEANPDNNTTTITLKDSNGRENSVTVATKDTDTRNTVKAGENVTLDTKDNADGSHEYTVNVKADGKVEAGSTKIVSGDTVYNETRVKQDGTYVKVSNTAGENLSALDNQVTSNTQNINYLNGRVGELGDRINKVGAGAAALAALHPLDFDPEDKWDFAAGVGNYRNATAAAVGIFYRPNERTMFNLGWTMGDNRNMVNGGFSLKFGKSNKYIKYSKAEMASVIDKQSREIAELKARDVQNAKDKAEMKADNAEMKAEIEALKKQVEALATKK